TVNGVAISRKAIAAEVQNFPARNPGEGWRAATRALVIRELLLQEARRLDIAVEQRTDQDGRRETIEDALVRGLIEREVRVPEADEEMLRRFY
ncbi:peptidylprolyl isomerase, partial [Mesorhizobium sp. M3A.F.Ca.ET.201.01.1.1]